MSSLNTSIKPLVWAMALASQQVYANCQTSYAVTNAVNAIDDISSLQGAIKHINDHCSDVDISVSIAAGLQISHGEFSHSVHDQERVSITGDLESPATITRDASDGFFNVNEGGQLSLKNVILDGNSSLRPSPGLSVSSASSRLELDNVIVKNFYSTSDGAAIRSVTAPITIVDSQFENNQSAGSGGVISSQLDAYENNGAVVYVPAGKITITGSSFTGNTADNNGGAISLLGGDIEIVDTIFTSNSSQSSGGAILAGGESGQEELTVKNSQFISNTAVGRGGAISQSNAGSVVIEESLFEKNIVSVDVNDTNNSGENISGNGGAASFYQFDSLEITNTTFDSNTSENFGGAITIDNNIAGDAGGEVLVSISDSHFNSNSVIKNVAKATVAHGGAIYTELTSNDTSAAITVSKTTFDQNTAEGNGGAFYIDDLNDNIEVTFQDSSITKNSAAGGAGFYISGSNILNIDRSLINENITTGHGSAVFAAGNYNGGDIQAPITRISNSTITDNQGQYGTLTFSGYYGEGTRVSHSTIHNNSTTQGAGALYGNGVSGTDAIVISHSIISNNSSPNGQLCNLNEANFSFSVEHSFISNADLGSGCLVLNDLGGNQMGSGDDLLDPMLEALADNGGETLSYYPADGSPVYNAGDANIENAPSLDQRGSARVMRGEIDIGAVEIGNALPVFTGLTDISIDVKEVLNWVVSLATDADGDAINYQVEGLPEGLLFDNALNTISGSINEAAFSQSESYSIAIIASDGFGETREERKVTFTGAFSEEADAEPEVNVESESSSGSGSIGYLFVSLLAWAGVASRKKRLEKI